MALLTVLSMAVILAPGRAVSDEEVEAPEVFVDPASTTREPALTKFPVYPRLARRDRIEGEATVCFKIAPNGRVLEPAVASSTHEIFEKPALQAIRESTFEPLGPGEELSATPVCRTYRFRLDPVETPEGP